MEFRRDFPHEYTQTRSSYDWLQNDIKRKKFREKYQVKDDEIAIGIVGRLTAVKNHKLFIDALANTISKTNKKIRAFIIGNA